MLDSFFLSHGGLHGVVRYLVGILNLANAVGSDAVLPQAAFVNEKTQTKPENYALWYQ